MGHKQGKKVVDTNKTFKEYLKCVSSLPDVLDDKTCNKCRSIAREAYFKSLTNLGHEDSDREPPYEYLHKKCTV